ncbi:MAG: serine/threonine protein kinase [Deltaproteobacteria bacterium]|nr:MAG: serine/threonine protein kinase [Deltaproteobacteria bacterium]
MDEKNEARLRHHFREGLRSMKAARYAEAMEQWGAVLRLDPQRHTLYGRKAAALIALVQEKGEERRRRPEIGEAPKGGEEEGSGRETSFSLQGDGEATHPQGNPIAEEGGEVAEEITQEASPTSRQSTRFLDIFHLDAGVRIAGRYEVVEPLGKGGTAVVYRARDLELFAEDLAIKILDVDSNDPGRTETVARFKREIALARQVNHPNVIRIFDYGVFQEYPYFTMEFVRGKTLRQIVQRRGPLPLQRALPIMKALCEALEAVHLRGIIHRDIKPQNIIVTEAGGVKLVDFGISKPLDNEDLDITGEPKGFGTPLFMSPEQLYRAPLDFRSDIYSLGVSFYYVLTGAFPFGTEENCIREALTGHPSPPSLHEASLGSEVDAVILKAIERKKEHRYRDMTEFRYAIESLDKHEGPKKKSPWFLRWFRRR